MKIRAVLLISLVLSVFSFLSCDVDFNPNDTWKETMVVYGLLDQDDDTTFIRVEKCFLGQGNALEFSQIRDSIYYKENELSVKLYGYNDWESTTNPVDSFEFKYSTVIKDSGSFFYDDNCPIYYCVTKGKLYPYRTYKLVVRNIKTGNVASSTTYPIGKYSIQNTTLTFYEKSTNRCKIIWYNKNSDELGRIAKQYQLSARFNYLQNGEIKHIDVPVSKVTNSNTTTSNIQMSAYVNMTDIVTGIKSKLKNQTGLSWYSTNPIQIYVNSINQEMFDYLSINNATESSLSYKPTYTNITNGIGLFAARRTHIHVSFSDKQIDQSLKTAIVALGLGF